MKKLIALIYFLTGIIWLHAQTFSSQSFSKTYFQYQKVANEHYEKKEYQQAAENYNQAIWSNGNKALMTDRFNLGACWAMLGYTDSAFVQLNYIANNRYQKYNSLVLNQELVPLHNDKRWNEFLVSIKDNRIKYNPKLNIKLMEALDTILQNDQQYRLTESATETKFGKDSKETKELSKLIHYHDSVNSIKVQKILAKYGWPATEEIGQEGNDAIFLTIQHSNPAVQEKLLPQVIQAVKNKNISPAYQALLEDRIAISKGQKQKYGTQIGTDKQGKYYVEPIEDPDNVDSRRAVMGLGPLSEYLKQWNIEWKSKNKK